MKFETKDDLTDWALDKFDKHGIKRPEEYSENELIYLNPEIPVDFIKEHVKNRKRK
jgi:hypothetical protein